MFFKCFSLSYFYLFLGPSRCGVSPALDDFEDWLEGLDDLYLWLYLLQSCRSRMEERTNDHAPQSDSPLPYAEGWILRAAGLQHRMDIFKAVLVPSEESAQQIDDNSCGVFCLSFLDSIIRGIPVSSITQSIVDKLRKDYVLEIFLNSTEPAD